MSREIPKPSMSLYAMMLRVHAAVLCFGVPLQFKWCNPDLGGAVIAMRCAGQCGWDVHPPTNAV